MSVYTAPRVHKEEPSSGAQTASKVNMKKKEQETWKVRKAAHCLFRQIWTGQIVFKNSSQGFACPRPCQKSKSLFLALQSFVKKWYPQVVTICFGKTEKKKKKSKYGSAQDIKGQNTSGRVQADKQENAIVRHRKCLQDPGVPFGLGHLDMIGRHVNSNKEKETET